MIPTNPHQDRIAAVDFHKRKIRFLRRIALIERFLEIFMDGSPEEIRAKRDELKAGLPMLEDPEARERCEELIRAFQARLYAIPHERYLARALRDGTLS